MTPDRAAANQKANMENTSQEINKKIGTICEVVMR